MLMLVSYNETSRVTLKSCVTMFKLFDSVSDKLIMNLALSSVEKLAKSIIIVCVMAVSLYHTCFIRTS